MDRFALRDAPRNLQAFLWASTGWVVRSVWLFIFGSVLFSPSEARSDVPRCLDPRVTIEGETDLRFSPSIEEVCTKLSSIPNTIRLRGFGSSGREATSFWKRFSQMAEAH
jgi:hypothetical protein